jgi:hypothetical protein
MDCKSLKKLVIKVEYYEKSENDIAKTDVIEFNPDGIAEISEIDADPTKAIVLALQIALKLKRFDTEDKGDFKIQSKSMQGSLDVSEWKG